MKKRKDYPIYKFIKWLVWVFYPKMEVVGTEKLPRHRVVPYRNIPRKRYPYNVPTEVDTHAQTGD